MIGFCEFQNPSHGSAIDNVIYRARVVFRDLAKWLRAYSVYVFLDADPKLQELIATRLLNAPRDYITMLKLFFGDQIADEYDSLFTNYIALFINLIHAQKSGDINAANEDIKQLYQNADQRADFLSKVNPFWQKATFQNLMYTFTGLNINQITTFLSKDYEQNLNIYDKLLSHTSVIGDYLAQGITNYLQYSSRQENPSNGY